MVVEVAVVVVLSYSNFRSKGLEVVVVQSYSNFRSKGLEVGLSQVRNQSCSRIRV